MQVACREDLLEAILALERSKKETPTVGEVALRICRTPDAIRSALQALEEEGDLLFLPDGTIALTPQGRSIGMRIERKHHVLQCFLSDILGMDKNSASNEACVLEHQISDQAIDRLDEFIEGAAPEKVSVHNQPLRGKARKKGSVLDFKEGDLLLVREVGDGPGNRRLIDLGVVPGGTLLVRRKLGKKAVVVRVKGADIAISGEIARLVLVERAP
jgi:DtxR family Mn-dependent transcriptional regulator